MNFTKSIYQQNRRKSITMTLFIGLFALLLVFGCFFALQQSTDLSANAASNAASTEVAKLSEYHFQGYHNIDGKSFAEKDLLGAYSIKHFEKIIVKGSVAGPGGSGLVDGTKSLIAGTTNCYVFNFSDVSAYCLLNTSTNILEFYKKVGNTQYLSLNDIKVYEDLSLNVDLPAEPVKEGYHFAGWFYDAEFTRPYVVGDAITSDTNFFAKMVINTYTVKFFVNGEAKKTITVNHGDVVTAPAIDVPVGKQLSDFTASTSGTGTAFDFATQITADTNLYSKLDSIMLTVKFFVGAELYKTVSVEYGTSFYSAPEVVALMNALNFNMLKTTIAEATIVTDDMTVLADFNPALQGWITFGIWLGHNWIWLLCLVVIIVVLVIYIVWRFKKQ